MVTMADLLDDRALGLVPVVDARRDDPLRWVATSELDDPSPFLEGGEVLLTTGLETVGWTRAWDRYVERLADAGVVAIGLAIEMTHPSAPPELVSACRQHGVDLFEVPRETRFVAISRALASQLQREEESATRSALESQRALTQAALRENEPNALVEELARVGAMAAVVGADGALLVGPYGSRPEVLDLQAVGAAVVQMRRQGLRAAASLSSPGATLLVNPLGVKGRPDRYLVVGFSARVGDAQRSTVTTGVALLSLAEERRRASREADRRLRSRAVELLVAGDVRTAQVLLGAGGADRTRLPRTAVVLRATGPVAALEDALGQLETGAAGLLSALVSRDPLTDDESSGRLLSGDAGSELVAVARPQDVAGVVQRLVAGGLRVGVGEPQPVVALSASHETAGHALRLTTVDAPAVSWSEGVRRGVLSLVDGPRAAAFAASYLAPLAAEPALVETLGSYLRHHGSLLKVADDLGVHRNTVRHRVERIEALLDGSLMDPQVRVDAWVALRTRQGDAR
jgi:purine catabolism regulator